MGQSTLVSLIKKLSYREGDFTLASGQKSSYYVDLKMTTLHPEGADLIGKEIVKTVLEKKWYVEAVGGPTLGADPIATAVSLAAYHQGIHWPAFIVRKEPKSHGTSQWIEGTENFKKSSPLLLLEDVVTTGGSGLKAVERLREEGYQPMALIAVVDRQQGAKEAYERAGLFFHALTTLKELLRS